MFAVCTFALLHKLSYSVHVYNSYLIHCNVYAKHMLWQGPKLGSHSRCSNMLKTIRIPSNMTHQTVCQKRDANKQGRVGEERGGGSREGKKSQNSKELLIVSCITDRQVHKEYLQKMIHKAPTWEDSIPGHTLAHHVTTSRNLPVSKEKKKILNVNIFKTTHVTIRHQYTERGETHEVAVATPVLYSECCSSVSRLTDWL